MSRKINEWDVRLNKLRKDLACVTDSELADKLGLPPQRLSEIRAGKEPSHIIKIKIMDKLGYVWARDALRFLAG